MIHRSRFIIVVLAVTVFFAAAHGHVAQRQSGRSVPAQPVAPGALFPVLHNLQVIVNPDTARIAVTDRVTLPPPGGSLPDFVLNAKLRILDATPPVEEVPLGAGREAWDPPGKPASVKRYRLRTMPSGRVCRLQYEGPVNFPLSPQKEEYTRGFRETRGTVSKAGVYLAGETAWYPQFGTRPVGFTMEAKATLSGWHLISQGAGTSRDANGVARWTSPQVMDEIYLVGGPLVPSRLRAGTVEVLVYLHQRDDALANRYLTTGADYIRMYSALIGPYPYDKFALIENFWETGYGMPSFTLLGPQVIRFPFILHSSFPHEILHNWWGNSVFVDYGAGNWCEGLTAYLSDHLVAEQHGGGPEHRRDVLQRYRDYVREGRDFRLVDFRARDSAATEAVGYGKALMVFHQLRREIGDVAFTSLLRRFYAAYRGQRASWKDLQRVAESSARRSLARFFEQWLSRPGAPSLQVRDVVVRQTDAGYLVTGSLVQTQSGRPYLLRVPVVAQMGVGVARRDITMDSASVVFEISCPLVPLALNVDPYFDVFRALATVETPASVSQMFGETRVLAVLPSRARPDLIAAYRALVAAWRTETQAIDIEMDSAVTTLPADRAIWFLGADNLLAPDVFRGYRETMAAPARGGARTAPAAGMTWVWIGRHPGNQEKAIGWIFSDNATALPALARKLPHYGKYSYLSFEGPDAVNRDQGQTRNASSPLRVDLRPSSDRRGALPGLPPDPGKPLAQLPAK